ncbi:FAD/NAD(P)-binding protein [Amycolatopsis sp. lyj-90]|uniref:FAD/NAD(P)-binding protein n=1 Tax=Amycolatopsis sp. lyj-90 TaxID=2789285 RepID=UPI003979D1A2
MTAREVAVVGVGPRGLSVLERLCANERVRPSAARVVVHVLDAAQPGAGAVWRTGQQRHLLTNTVASQITVYSDAASRIEGPIEEGPSLYEWAAGLALLGDDGHDAPTLAEIRALGPDSYPTRALCGEYFAACFRRIRDNAPAHVEIRVHHARVVALIDVHGHSGGPQGLRLEDETWLDRLDAVVLAQGHLPARLTANEERTASLARVHGLTYLTPVNPADTDLDGIAGGQPVLVRGLGLCFFDYQALFTLGRGGRFERDGGRLVYRPSGLEPILYASSRRGLPYHSRGENEKGAHGRYFPRLLTAAHVATLRSGAPASFVQDLWPLIAREVETVYYEALLARRRRDGTRFAARYLACEDPAKVLDAFGIPAADRWNWDVIAGSPRNLEFADRAEFRTWLLKHLAEDVRQAQLGNVSGPLKAALDVLRDLRNEVRLAVDHGGLRGSSHRDELERWYTPLNAFLSIGPPPRRIEEMIALIEAGLLELTGPDTRIRIDARDRSFVADSATVSGPPVRAKVLIEARLPEPDLRRTTDPLLRHLFDTGACASHRVGGYETGGLAVTTRPYRLIDASGCAHPRRFAYGVPTEGVHWVTAAGIRPGVDSVTIADADAIARAVQTLAVAERPEVAEVVV